MSTLNPKAWGRSLAALALGWGLLAPAANAAYPEKPIRLIVPFSPGGAVDGYARITQQALSKILGQTVVIENRAGASGMIGSELVARAPADGYTLLLGNIATLAINPGIYKKMAYDPLRDLTPIAKTVIVNYALVVNPKVPAQNVRELIAYAKANPGKLSYGSSGSGSAQHMAAELFKARTGVNLLHVPYKGTGALGADLLAGHIHLIFADQGTMMPHVEAGKLRGLGVGGLSRSPDYPDVPTVAEAGGIEGFEAVAWQGLVGPAGMPADIVRKLNAAINQVQADPAIRQQLNKAGLTPDSGTPEAFRQYIEAEIQKWGKLARDVQATVD